MTDNTNFDVSDDTIFISGLPENTTEEQISEFFGQIGIIKLDKKTHSPKIWIYKDKESGRGKGEATVTYDDPPTASSAINWFNDKEFHGSKITVSLARRKPMPQFNRGGRGGGRGGGGRNFHNNRFGDRGGYGSGGGGGDRDRNQDKFRDRDRGNFRHNDRGRDRDRDRNRDRERGVGHYRNVYGSSNMSGRDNRGSRNEKTQERR